MKAGMGGRCIAADRTTWEPAGWAGAECRQRVPITDRPEV